MLLLLDDSGLFRLNFETDDDEFVSEMADVVDEEAVDGAVLLKLCDVLVVVEGNFDLVVGRLLGFLTLVVGVFVGEG